MADGSPGAVRVVLVVGPGGQGKTTLMVHAAHLLRGEFPDGQLYASLLGATQPADPAEVLARFLRDLGADPARIPLDAEERAALYRTRLDGRRVLVVLDDARGIDQVRPLLPGSASCAVLITARNWLPELAGGAVLDLDVLSEDEARHLFTKIVGGKRVAAEPGAAAEVLTACAGLPLAIRIAGARLATRGNWSIRTLASRLSDERSRLDELRVGNLAVRASFEVSFATLRREAADGAVRPGAVSACWACGPGHRSACPPRPPCLASQKTTVAGALDVLFDAHLLESPEPDRYRFHDLLRVYAADRARTEEDRTRPHGRDHPRPHLVPAHRRSGRRGHLARSTPGFRLTRPTAAAQPAALRHAGRGHCLVRGGAGRAGGRHPPGRGLGPARRSPGSCRPPR